MSSTRITAEAPKITMVGAGGMSFGPTMVNDVVHTAGLSGARLVLHDVNRERLDRAYRFAAKLNASSGAPVILDRTTDPAEALTGADFVLSSAEFGRFEHWRQDYEIPNRHGARQITGENGGPGAVFHSLRSITNTLGICADIERYCPDAFLINLTNPMSRVTLAINRATKVRNVGMCHEMPMGINRLARRLRVKRSDIEARASGINHFTFFTEFRNKRTGEDLLPTIRAWFEKPVFDYSPRTQRVARRLDRSLGGAGLVEFNYMPLVTHVVREHGLVPCSVDSHIGEYLPFALDVADWMPVPMDFHEPFSELAERAAAWAADTRVPLPMQIAGMSGEEVAAIIDAMWNDEPARILAVNVPNDGYLPDVADGAIVEVGAVVDGDGIHPEHMDPLGEPLAGWVKTQVELQELVVEAALAGDADLAFKAVREDPCSPPDEASCRAMFDELRHLQADKLPF
ncbi:alpha-galactosidase [Candidatus Microthrix parvicella]|uniref:Putative Alpha-galactosidase n=2 Tax=Candidatus Neomicrothrix TaxID=41949 RepID=R4YX25_9ACTN|nr:alpha-galactosidase [Candidatus Microthrix parvicella]CCM62834.1 putative Alpha-galactosidase [Candidatus Microthrix parvicella RN1]